MKNALPYILMRGGTSRGPFIKLSDLPANKQEKSAILMKLMGSGHELQLDGIGGGNSLTSKVAMVGLSDDERADVDYFFAQVGVEEQSVDFAPNCGNMLSGVAPFAIETGMVKAQEGKTQVRIKNINTGKIIYATVLTKNGEVVYDGDYLISGTSNKGSPIDLKFLDVAGAKTGKLLPTGRVQDEINDIKVSCIDAATPVMIVGAQSLGKSGYELPSELDNDKEFMDKLETIRRKAGTMMGLGDVSNQVIPKPILVSKPRQDGSINARYFVPNKCHKAIAVTGAIAITASLFEDHSIAAKLLNQDTDLKRIRIEHPSGYIDLVPEFEDTKLTAISVIRTARKISTGSFFLTN